MEKNNSVLSSVLSPFILCVKIYAEFVYYRIKITLTPGTTAFYRPSPPNRTNLNARLEEDRRTAHARLASRTPSSILVASEKGDPN